VPRRVQGGRSRCQRAPRTHGLAAAAAANRFPRESGILYRLYDDGMIILSFALYRTAAAIMIIVTQKIKE